MTNTNGHGPGHGPKRAITYSRVSGDRQRDHGYSLDDQRRELHEWCDANSFSVVEEVEDGAWSGGDLQRPGLDRVREIVARGGADAVVVLFRDRLARGVYAQLLSEEFATHGCRLIALNAQLDDSPEGELQGGILDVISGWERRKIKERTARGKLAKARKGFIVAARRPPHGFIYIDDRNGYEVDEETMSAVRRIFDLISNGASIRSVSRTLAKEAYSAPEASSWSLHGIRNIIHNDVYLPHTHEELSALVDEGLLAPDVLARLDKNLSYGVAWFNRTRRTTTKEPIPEGGYRKRSHTIKRPRSEWIPVPVPDSHIPREWVIAAREAIRDNRVPSRAGDRFAELSGGIFFCSGCGKRMAHHTTWAGTPRRRYYYYKCPTVIAHGRDACPAKKYQISAPKVESAVWKAVSAASAEVRRIDLISAHFEKKANCLRRLHDDLSGQARLTESLGKLDRKRDGFLDLRAEGIITMGELKEKLAGIAEQREVIQSELDSVKNKEEQLVRLLSMRDMLVDSVRNGFLDQVARDVPEERHALYKRMGLRIELDQGGSPIISGAFDMFSNDKPFSRQHPRPCPAADA
jgi:site-specific DNA recombinase